MKNSKPWVNIILYCLLMLPLNLSAHSFDIAVIAPFSSEKAIEGQALWNGMRVATRERDGHDSETSDGHLGGVDSQLLKFDSVGDKNRLLTGLTKIGADQGFIIAVLNNNNYELISMIPEDIPHIVIIHNQDSNIQNANIIAPSMIEGNAKHLFQNSYVDQYQQTPDDSALAGYTAARLIDAAIRQTDGDFTHSGDVQKAFMDAIRLTNNIH